MPGIFRVEDFGAIANDGIDDRVAIQAALNAAKAAGGGEVIMQAGQYDLTSAGSSSKGCLQISSNITLRGAGMEINGGGTVLRVMDGSDDKITGVVRTPVSQVTENVTLTGFTIDGNRANTSNKVDAFFCGVFPGDPRHCNNITVDGVEAKNCSGYGFDPHEQTFNLTIKNSVAHGNGLDGFVADYIVGGTFENNLAFDNDRHGFNITTQTTDFQMLENVAHSNGGNGIVVQRGGEDIPFPHHILIQGGLVYNNSLEGIYLKMTDHVTVTGVDVYENGKTGISIKGATNNHITENTVFNNGQNADGTYDEIEVLLYDDRSGASGLVYVSANNLIDYNTIFANDTIRTRYGIEERNDGSFNTDVLFNDISGSKSALVVLSANSSSYDDGEGTTGTGPVVITNAQNQIITGTSGNDILFGGGGNDIIDGLGGADRMTGDLGNDIYYVDNTGDVVVEKTGGGIDTVNTSVSYTINSTIENLILLDGAVSGSGSSNANIIVGNSANNTISGGSGNDTLFGMGGNDTITGGTGNDLVSGEDGNDTLKGGDGNDTIVGGLGVDSLYGNAGADIFLFASLAESGKDIWGARDIIRDYSQSQSDKVDFTTLGSLDFIGNANFTNNGVGQVNYKWIGSHTILGVDADGNGVSDMEVAIINQFTINESDLLLA